MRLSLDALLASRWAVQVRTKHPDGAVFYGIVLENKRKFIVIQNITSFECDGVVVIPKKWIKGIRNGKYEKCLNEILHEHVTSSDISLSVAYFGAGDLKGIVNCLHQEDIWPAIEVLFKNESSLYMGSISHVANDSFVIRCYNAAGEWEKEYELDYDEIFKIEIDSKYVSRFNDHMRAKQLNTTSGVMGREIG